MDRWGRRWPLCLLMILRWLLRLLRYKYHQNKWHFLFPSGITCICTVLIPENAVVETLVLFLISKSMISASFLIIYPFAGELYPTQVRGVGIGTSSYIGGMGLIVIPFITYLVLWFTKKSFNLILINCSFTGQRKSSPSVSSNGIPFRHRRIYRLTITRNTSPSTTTNVRRRWRVWKRLERRRMFTMYSLKV